MQSSSSVLLGLCALVAYGCGGFDSLAPAGQSGTTSGQGGSAGDNDGDGAAVGGGPGAGGDMPGDAGDVGPSTAPMGIHVVTTPKPHLEDADGKTVVLHGVNRSGTEYRCVQGGNTIFDGDFDEASVQAIATWKVNAVRVPLNEACWLNLTQNGAMPGKSGDIYKDAIRAYVALLQKHGLVPILDLHWVGPGNSLADRLQPLPDLDHAPAFWTDVATTFKSNTGVVFEPFNEPFPDSNRESAAAWQCWRDGCTANQMVVADAGARTYQATGMAALVDAIRTAGATNLILLGGVQYSNGLTQWLTYRPTDTADNLAAAWHVYNNNPCINPTCWDSAPAAVAAQFPIVVTEMGENDCMGTFITPLMQWLDDHQLGYLAWSWNAFGACRPAGRGGQRGQPWSLVTDYRSATPNSAVADAGLAGPSYAQTFHDHVMGLAP